MTGSVLSRRTYADARNAPQGVIVAGFRGTVPGDPEVDAVRALLAAGELAGVILLRRNITSPDQVLKLSLAFREAAGSFVPIVAVDQEGGAVARLDAMNGFSDWMSAADVALALPTEKELFDYYLERTRELSSVGINVNFGPVIDLNRNAQNPIIGGLDRSFSVDVETVVRCAAAFVDAHRAAGVMTCCKHFPGHGSSTTDSHVERTDITQTWSDQELVPFQTLAATGRVDALMTSHLVLKRFSDEGLPVSLSTEALNYIRTEMGFNGAVFTDDIQMAAIEEAYSESAAAVAAIAAGNTFLIYANHKPGQNLAAIDRVNRAVASAATNGVLRPADQERRSLVASAFLDGLR